MEILNTVLQAVGVQFQEDEQQHREENQSGTTVTEEGQRDPDGGQ